jgi:NTE family protein
MGLVLTGGGARAAYQVGVLCAISEFWKKPDNLFQIYAGVSAGAINASFLTAGANDFRQACLDLRDLWENLSVDKVYRTDARTLVGIGSRLMRDLSTGGLFKSADSHFLLHTDPLRELIEETLDLEALRRNCRSGKVRGLAVTATNYLSGTAISFFEGAQDIADWNRITRLSQRTELTADHIMASSAIPLFFPAIRIGQQYFGDGCIRLSSPLSPAIHLGADKVLGIGIRHNRTIDEVRQANYAPMERISLADIAGTILNAIFLDMLESDLERMERINRTIEMLPENKRNHHPDQLRVIPIMTVRPSVDLGRLAAEGFRSFPTSIRYLLRGIGAQGDKGWDLLSYLAFDSSYVHRLLELGYNDALVQRDELEEFLEI